MVSELNLALLELDMQRAADGAGQLPATLATNHAANIRRDPATKALLFQHPDMSKDPPEKLISTCISRKAANRALLCDKCAGCLRAPKWRAAASSCGVRYGYLRYRLGGSPGLRMMCGAHVDIAEDQ
jgi:hypothetical protein